MGLIKEDFIRCTECNNAEFEERQKLTFSKLLKERDDKSKPLQAMEVRLAYHCSKCGHELLR